VSILSETDRVNIALKAIGERNVARVERAMAALDFKLESVVIAGSWSISFTKGGLSPSAQGVDREATTLDAASAALFRAYPRVFLQHQGE
jgi:hypothetical protein